jgi:hypothetical protein
MTRIRIWVDGHIRIDEPTSRADVDLLDRACDDLELECLAHNRRLLIVAERGNVSQILVQV